MISTANDLISSSHSVSLNVPRINGTVDALILSNTPDVLSLGRLCVAGGFQFHWPAYSHSPTLTMPTGQVVELYVRGYVPYLDSERVPVEDANDTYAMPSPAGQAAKGETAQQPAVRAVPAVHTPWKSVVSATASLRRLEWSTLQGDIRFSSIRTDNGSLVYGLITDDKGPRYCALPGTLRLAGATLTNYARTLSQARVPFSTVCIIHIPEGFDRILAINSTTCEGCEDERHMFILGSPEIDVTRANGSTDSF